MYYGKKYSEKDSGITLRICNRTPKSFEPLDTKTHTLVLLSKAMDHKVAKADEDGNVILLNKIVVLKAGEVCGEIYISDNKASMDNLLVGNIPAIAFLCKNITRINRYPLAGKYEFKPIEKTDSSSLKGSGPNPCNL